jgi:hypothetical protein
MRLRTAIRSCALIVVLASSSVAEQKYDFDDADPQDAGAVENVRTIRQ